MNPQRTWWQQILWVITDVLAVARAQWVLRPFGPQGQRIRFRVKPFINVRGPKLGAISVGSRTVMYKGPVPTEFSVQPSGRLEIGESCMINYGCIFNASGLIRIGNRCRFGYYVIVMDSNLHRFEPELRAIPAKPKAVILEDDVWIATRSTILPGVRIGQGSIVAAGSVVTKDVPPRTIVGGVPARVIGSIDDKIARSILTDMKSINLQHQDLGQMGDLQ